MFFQASLLRSALGALLCSTPSLSEPVFANGFAPVVINGTQLTMVQLRQL